MSNGGLERMDRALVVTSANAVVLQIVDYVQKRFGQSVGPVWITSVQSHPDEETARLGGRPVDTLMVKFGQGSSEKTLNVPVEMLARDGVEAIGTIYDRLMGKR